MTLFTAHGNRLACHLAVAVEASVQLQARTRYRDRQPVARMTRNGKRTGLGEQPVVVVAVARRLPGIGGLDQLEVVVIAVGKRLVQAA